MQAQSSRRSLTTTQVKHDKHHDTHALPPMFIQEAYWHYNKVKASDLENDHKVVDIAKGLSPEQAEIIVPVGSIEASTIDSACAAFSNAANTIPENGLVDLTVTEDATVYGHKDFPLSLIHI